MKQGPGERERKDTENNEAHTKQAQYCGKGLQPNRLNLEPVFSRVLRQNTNIATVKTMYTNTDLCCKCVACPRETHRYLCYAAVKILWVVFSTLLFRNSTNAKLYQKYIHCRCDNNLKNYTYIYTAVEKMRDQSQNYFY